MSQETCWIDFETLQNFMQDVFKGLDEAGQKTPYCLGHFFMAVNIEAFTELAAFKKTTGDILRELRESQRAEGADRIYTCGEKEYLAWLERKDKGVPVGSALQQQMLQMRNELGLSQYRFAFDPPTGHQGSDV